MSVELVVDAALKGLAEEIMSVVSFDSLYSQALRVSKTENTSSNIVFVREKEKTRLVIFIITVNDFFLLLRNNCAADYFTAVHDATKSPLFLIVLGQVGSSRQTRFWQGVSHLCADDVMLEHFVGFDVCSSFRHVAEVVVAHGLKASRPPTETNCIVRSDGGRKCDPTDCHALYLDMLLEISSVSERRAAVIAGVFPSICHLLAFIAGGGRGRLHVEEYGEGRLASALDAYIVEVLSNNYNITEPLDTMKTLVEFHEKNLFL